MAPIISSNPGMPTVQNGGIIDVVQGTVPAESTTLGLVRGDDVNQTISSHKISASGNI